MTNSIFEPGMLVRMDSQSGWGIGQIQSVIGEKVTVNFENQGKLVLNTDKVKLSLVFLDE
jgi:FKBP-type peptidyl-prolyl cis-trans isomerase 2